MVGSDRAHESMTQRNVLINGCNQQLEQTLNMLKTEHVEEEIRL